MKEVLSLKIMKSISLNVFHRWSKFFKILAILVVILLFMLYYLNFIGTLVPREQHIFPTELKLDKRPEPTPERIRQLIHKELPALPLETLLENAGKNFAMNATCAPYPTIYDIEFQNDYWQVARIENQIAYIFGAYYDKRLSVPEAPVVRVLTMFNEVKGKYPPMYCHLWFDDRREPLIVPVTDQRMIWYEVWGNTPYHTYPTLFACKMPDGMDKYKIPQTVSLVAHECDKPTNNLRVHYELPSGDVGERTTAQESQKQQHNGNKEEVPHKRLRFAVCVKSLDFPYVDMSARFIEWLEMMRILGAEKVTIYEAQLHPNVSRVLRHYERTTGFVDFRSFSMARGEPHATRNFNHLAMEMDGLNRILNEIIPYNDCFYRNLYKYDIIAICDMDEVMMPLGNLTNWNQLIEVFNQVPDKGNPNCKSWASYCFLNVYFPRYPEIPPYDPDLPSYFYMLQHVKRVPKHLPEGDSVKCLHTTKYAVTLHNHYPISFTESCGARHVPIEYGHMQHYREPKFEKAPSDPVLDDNIWRFKEILVSRTTAMLKEMGFLPD